MSIPPFLGKGDAYEVGRGIGQTVTAVFFKQQSVTVENVCVGLKFNHKKTQLESCSFSGTLCSLRRAIKQFSIIWYCWVP